MRPHRVIGLYSLQFVEPHDSRADIEPLVRLAHHGGRPVGCVQLKPALNDARRVPTTAAAKLQHLRAGCQPVEERVEMSAGRLPET